VTDQDLAYWLQGAFEIVGITEITDAQADIIGRHVALVQVTDPRSTFAAQIGALLRVSKGTERADLIRPVVASLFQHVIDPKHPKPAAANFAHHGDHGPVLYRC
jgi:hypothetical protein